MNRRLAIQGMHQLGITRNHNAFAMWADQCLTNVQQSRIQQFFERNTNLCTFWGSDLYIRQINRFNRGNTFPCSNHIRFFTVNSNKITSQFFGGGGGCTAAHERIQNYVTLLGRCQYNTTQQIHWFLCIVQTLAICALDTFFAQTNIDIPIRTHLLATVQLLHRFVIKRIFAGLARGCPNQCFVCICKACTAEIRHRICFHPNNIIQNPEPQIL